jgi:flagellar motor protein MotB
MARKQKQAVVQESAPGAPAWMLTFCDCMTLLLTFFVLLLSFSSFDPSTQKQLNGAMKFKSSPTITDNKVKLDRSVSVEVTPVEDLTDKGSEKKRSDDEKMVKNPKKIEPGRSTAEHEEAVLSMAIDDLFLGQSTILTASGKKSLNTLASYLKLVSRYVVIGESPAARSAGGPGESEKGLQRAWVVLEFLRRTDCLGPEQFRISSRCPRPVHSKENKSTMQIVLLARDVTRSSGGG